MTPELFQIDPQELAGVVPDCYARFRPIVADGLMFFLRHLSPARLAEIFQGQADLPSDADLPSRLVRFMHACPALHKLGQVLARNRHLDRELRQQLQRLESLEPHTPFEEVRPLLVRELAPAVEKYRIRAADQILAEASVAVVVPLTWSDPTASPGQPPRHGVAKLLKPGVVGRLHEDLDILDRLASYLEERQQDYGLPPLEYRAILAEVADLLTHEVQVRHEQGFLRRARQQYAGQWDLLIPELLPFCSEEMTAMERVFGQKITEGGSPGARRKPALFVTAVRALLSTVFFSRDPAVLFHGDPHAGNLLATDDGRVAILDWSLAGELTADDRVQMAQILLGALGLDAERIRTALGRLVRENTCTDVIHSQVDAALARLRLHRPPGPSWAVELLDSLAHAGVRFPPRLLLFRKAFLTLQGVLADLCPWCSLEATLMGDALVQFLGDWPTRWWKSLDDRDYATHVSSADLAHLALRTPAALARLWSEALLRQSAPS